MNLSFAAIDPMLEDNIITNDQKEIRGQKFIQYGDKNIYPNYLHDLVENVSILKSVINGISGCFENIEIRLPQFQNQINEDGDSVEDVVRQIIKDYETYGGFALNIVRNKFGKVAAIYNIDFRNLRSDKKNKHFYYSEDWAKKSCGRVKAVEYPAFSLDGKDINSVFYYKNDKYATYPSPSWGGSAVAAECLKHIGEFHLNSLYNGLGSDYIVNMNSGVPADEIKEAIEEEFNEKFFGFQNASRCMLSWNADKDHATTINAIPNNNFVDKYNALEKTSKENIYTAFNVSPIILGLPTENTGFADNDVKESFEITKKLAFEPILKIVKQSFEKIFGEKDVVRIEIISIDWNAEGETDIVQ